MRNGVLTTDHKLQESPAYGSRYICLTKCRDIRVREQCIKNAFHTNRIRETFGDVLDGNESACHRVFGASVIKQQELERLVPES